MPNCAVRWCGNSSRNKNFTKDNITFHRFPTDPSVKEDWINRTMKGDNWFPTPKSTICSKHFTLDCFKNMKGRRRLFNTAVPTLFLPSLQHISEKESNKNKLCYERQQFSAPPETETTCENPSTSKSNIHNNEKIQFFSKRKKVPRYSSPIGSDLQIDDAYSIYERDATPVRTADDGDATVPEGRSRRHEGYRCDVCRGDIVGSRYACVQCADWDLCGACEARGEHAAHYVLRVPAVKLDSDVRAVIQKIRDQLQKEDMENSIKIEIKVENDQEQDPLEKTCEDEPHQDTSNQDIRHEEGGNSFAVKYLGPVESQSESMSHQHQTKVQFHRPRVRSHQAKVQSHQAKVQFHQAKVQFRRPKMQSQTLPVAPQEKITVIPEGILRRALVGEVVVKMEAVGSEGEGEDARARSDHIDNPTAEPPSSREKCTQDTKKRKIESGGN